MIYLCIGAYAFYLFTTGFLIIANNSLNINEQRTDLEAPVDRVILILIDALRYDFVDNEGTKETSSNEFYLNEFSVIKKTI
jgi:predicted AlkP superfamily pyrophosphatase or phosphodiesterase